MVHMTIHPATLLIYTNSGPLLEAQCFLCIAVVGKRHLFMRSSRIGRGSLPSLCAIQFFSAVWTGWSYALSIPRPLCSTHSCCVDNVFSSDSYFCVMDEQKICFWRPLVPHGARFVAVGSVGMLDSWAFQSIYKLDRMSPILSCKIS